MHAARLSHSSRLQRVYAVLSGPGEYSTREIMERAHVCAVNSCISELRHAGAQIECTWCGSTARAGSSTG